MSRRFLWLSAHPAALLLLASISVPISAQAFVEHLEPPALERGKTTRVTLVGSQLGQALDLWTSLPPGVLKATPVGASTPTRAVFDVSVSATAPVGICGVRLSTVDGLGNAFLVLIDDLPVRPAPAADVKPAQVSLPAALWGRFREATVDHYTIAVTAHQAVSFEVVGNRLGKDVDPLLTIRDAKGRLVTEHDNDPGLYFDCRFQHIFAEAGTYIVEVRDARYHGSEHGFYVLRMGRFPAARIGRPTTVPPGQRVEIELPELKGATVFMETPRSPAAGLFFGEVRRPGDEGSTWLPLEASTAHVTLHSGKGTTLDEGTAAKVPGVLCGVLEHPGARHYYRLELAKGQKIQLRAEARPFNSPADVELAITDAKGKELRRASENNKEEIVLDFAAGNPGIYGLSVRDLNRDGGPAFAYRIEALTGQPQILVNAEVEGLTVPRGDYQPVPLTITRVDYAGPVALTLVGAPPGLTIVPTEIEAGVNAIVCKLIAAPDTPLGLHTLQILARPTTLPDALPTLVHTRPLIDRQLVNVDLIPYALREDQRRLPPALMDRLAVQITPPAPFTLELPEAQVTLGRYQQVEYPIAITRTKGFSGPITFSAKGGQIAPKEEGRTRVYAEFAADKGSIHSKILTNLTKHRVEVTAVGRESNRRTALTRTFDLDIRTAFVVTAEPALTKLLPGESAKVRLIADRMKSFAGDVTVHLSPAQGMSLPEKVVIPKGKASAEIEVKVEPERGPGRQNINVTANAVVNGFEEEQRGGRFEIEVVKMAARKK